MKKYPLSPFSTNFKLLTFIFLKWDSLMLRLAKDYARRMAIDYNKAYYGSQMFNRILVYSSEEKKGINKTRPEGNKMNHAEVLLWSLFIISPEQARKKNT